MEQQVFGGEYHTGRPARPLWTAMKRGFLGRCPHCGEGKLFASFLKIAEKCDHCGEEMFHHRADDLPAYLVVVIVGHIVVGAFMGVEANYALETWQHLAIWAPLTVIAPAVGFTSPAIVDSRVVLPLPLDPTSATAEARLNRNELGASATVEPKCTHTSEASTSTSGGTPGSGTSTSP